MNEIFLHLGANQGNALKNILIAIGLIETEIGQIVNYSKYYKTAAWGKTDQPDFINIAIKIMSRLQPNDLLQQTQRIEQKIGRNKDAHWGARDIDIDILYYNQLIMESPILTIPHPHIAKRNFVLIPLLDLDADYVDPLQQKTIEELYLSSRDESAVILL